MPIEFRCSQCGKLLRTGDDSAGRQAQCPECGAISAVPSSSTPGQPITPSPSASPSGSPFGAVPKNAEAPSSANPYQSPLSPAYSAFGEAGPDARQQRLAGPAIALTVTAILAIVAHLGIAVLYGVVGVAAQNHQLGHNQDGPQLMMGVGMMEMIAFVGVIMSVVVLIGAHKMKNLESHSWAMAAAIIAVCPCISPCLLLGLPFGIWAIVVLSDVSVKAAFRG